MTAQQVDLLVRADYLYPMSDGSPIIVDGEVAIKNGLIVYVGTRKPDHDWNATETIDGDGRLVLPGFVNCHTHAASLVFRSQTDEHSTAQALYSIAFVMEKSISNEEWQVLATLGCLDMIRSGFTTINDIWYNPDGLAHAVSETGLRANIANKVFDVKLENLKDGDYQHYSSIGEQRLGDAVGFVEKWHAQADGRITGRIATHASDTCSSELHQSARAEADRLTVGMHIHTAQSPIEVEQIKQTHGCGPLEYLRDIGMLRDDVVAAHMTYADDNDLKAVAETGACYAHCPTIYPRRGVYPRLWDIKQRKITTGFATDWMLNDPFEGMRNAIQACRLVRGNASELSCQQALWHYTMGSAVVLGMRDQIGSLEIGKRADLIMIDVNKPHLQPYYASWPALVFYARANDVCTSIIDGRVVMRDGELQTIDEATALASVKSHMPKWTNRLRELGSSSLLPDYSCSLGC